MEEKIPEKTVSIIVPVYNVKNFLKKCVDSILAQSFRGLEIILVDDGSKDKSPQMCDDYAKQDSRIRVLHKPNGGLISAWMAGVERSTGEYLMFVDSDDWIDACMVEELLKRASGEPGEIVCCNFVIERPNGTEECRHELAPGVYEGERLETEVKRRLLGNERRTVSMSRCMKLFSRELILSNLNVCEPKVRMGEDVNIVLPALCDCRRLVILKDALYYHYYYNPASIVHKYDPGMTEGIRELARTIQTIFAAKGVENGEWQAKREQVYLMMLSLKNELRGGRKGCSARIAKLCQEDRLADSLKQYDIRAQDRANRVIVWVMKKPGAFRCAAGKLAFGLYDRWIQKH